MRSRALACLFLSGVLSLLASACTGATQGPVAPITTVSLDAGRVADASTDGATADPTDAGEDDEDAQAPGALFACTADSDCVAVAKNSCCNNGFREAVNKQQVDAYKASFTCQPRKRKICPMFRIHDTRAPHCNADSHKCELVKSDSAPVTP